MKKNLILFIFCGLIILFTAKIGMACGCGGRGSTAEAFQNSKIVFVGEVVKVIQPPIKHTSKKNPDGSTTVFMGEIAPTTFQIAVKKAFRGIERQTVEFVQSRGDTCSYRFTEGEMYLIFAYLEKDKIKTHKCTNTNLLSKSLEAVKYIEGVIGKKTQSLISGNVYRKILDNDGKSALQSPFEELKVFAQSEINRYEATAEQFGGFEIVLPPNDYQIWVERNGKRISKIEKVSTVDGKNKELLLQVEF